MSYFALVLESSRKAKTARHVYEYLIGKAKGQNVIQEIELEQVHGFDGIRVEQGDKYRVLNVRLHDEHLSPYLQTDMNLFQLLMIDEHAEIYVFRAERGWLFVFKGLSPGPKPFGQLGFDTR